MIAKPLSIAGLLVGFAMGLHAAVQESILHGFNGGSEGSSPGGDITVLGSVMYGLTFSGTTNGAGTIFEVNNQGGGFTVLHSFATNANPTGSLTQGGTTLYGVTSGQGAGNPGTIFKIGTDGSNFQTLYTFNGVQGRNPLGALLLIGTTLYGMANAGGLESGGTIFSFDLGTNTYAVLHDFTAPDGFPAGSLVTDGTSLYGMTAGGGVIFKYDLTGPGYRELTRVDGGPQGSLVLSDGELYGMTSSGGTGNGTVFKVDTSGANLTVLHKFSSATDDGELPSGSLTLVGSNLFGTTQSGGSTGHGTVFQIDTGDGSTFSLLYSFAGGPDDGASPEGSLTFSNGVFYGTTGGGGSSSSGTVFALAAVPSVPTPTPTPSPTPSPIPTPTPVSAPPVLTLLGKKKIVVTSPKVSLHGNVAGAVTGITYRIGSGKWRSVSGTALWKIAAKVAVGKSTISIVAHGPGGDSATVRISVTYKPAP